MDTHVKIIVAGELRIAQGRRDEFIERSLDAIKQARSSVECINFAISADPIDQNRVNIFELWTSENALMKFRGEGPDDSLAELIIDAQVSEFHVRSS